MDFKKTTDTLLDRVTHEELAGALGVSVPTIRQARLDPTAAAHRSPPEGWERAVLQIAEGRTKHYQQLADRIRKSLKAGNRL